MHKNLENGRSMIEMLGVLAIIAVLTVGGIAGYSKALEQYKFIKLRNAWTEVFYNFIQNKTAYKSSYLFYYILRD